MGARKGRKGSIPAAGFPQEAAPVTGGNVNTNYGKGTLPDGTVITFFASDATHAVIQTPTALAGRAITRDGLATTMWRLV